MKFDPNDKTLCGLAGLGAVIAVGKLLVGGQRLTLRLMIGRVIIGAALSMAAGAALALLPDLPQIALIGLGSTLGISGQAFLELLVQRWLDKRNRSPDDE